MATLIVYIEIGLKTELRAHHALRRIGIVVQPLIKLAAREVTPLGKDRPTSVYAPLDIQPKIDSIGSLRSYITWHDTLGWFTLGECHPLHTTLIFEGRTN